MNAVSIATITDVENALLAFQVAVEQDPNLEARYGKKLANVVDALTPRDSVTKDLNQAFNHGESSWAKNVLNGELDGCTKDNKLAKIKEHILKTAAYNRLINNTSTKAKTEQWIATTFPTSN